ncbi:MAG: N-acetyltransferase [Asticcacaulis sp.]
MQIEDEQSGDAPLISALTTAAFRDAPHSDQRESAIIIGLRDAGALTLSLVVRKGAELIGHIAFSPVRLTGVSGDWYGLGPVSVAPEHQRQGIAAGLIREGLRRIQAGGAAGCTVVGDPAYYQRFGFRHFPTLSYAGIPDEYVMGLGFHDTRPSGQLSYHAAFSA